ncbi:ACT domain-containing protein [Aliivibrio sp. EL58]|uniref:ACT domain-containing protein n=1 Tax=Aliivibrio sp. EL58 TaxID=2107582 RepID=UPI000EFA9A4A|nr:ACT domain-containing protein [Aliivibrio sp. EL58]
MSGMTDLDMLLTSMSPQLMDGDYVFCTVKGALSEYVQYNPLATYQEREGLTLVLSLEEARRGKFEFDGVYRLITLMVHSSLDAVGLTAAVANKLKSYGISANVIAAYYHDHIFIQKEKAELALTALKEFSS